jgi:NAD-dependent DNA ligase
VLADGLISEDERLDLADTMAQLVGGDAGILDGQNAATRLPLDEPTPVIHFSERRFVFTGKFASGTRKACQARVQQAGGHCDADVTMRTSYLVIGTFGSRDWVQTSHGRKIERAVEYRTRGVDLAIVGEQHWLRSCPAGVSA